LHAKIPQAFLNLYFTLFLLTIILNVTLRIIGDDEEMCMKH